MLFSFLGFAAEMLNIIHRAVYENKAIEKLPLVQKTLAETEK